MDRVMDGMYIQGRKRIYLFFGCVTAVGFAAGILFGGELSLTPLCEIGYTGGGFSPAVLALAFARLEKYLLLIFMSGFTVFAPVINFIISLYLGASAGHALSMLWLTRPSVIVYVVQGVVIAAAAALYMDTCEKSTTHRLTLGSSAPSVRAMLSMTETRRYIIYFCGATLFMALISSALYALNLIIHN